MENQKNELVVILKQVLDGALPHQTPDGLFHNNMDEPDTFTEAAAGEMMAYGIFESVRGGWLPASYLPAAQKMREGARSNVDKYGYVRNVCGAPDFNKSGISPEAQAFFLLMEVAAKKLERAR